MTKAEILRLKQLSGLNESLDLNEGTEDRVIALYRQLLKTLKKEYADDTNMQGIVYHFEESLENEIMDAGYDQEDEYDGSSRMFEQKDKGRR